MNQSDLSSWMLAGSYVVKADVPHQYQFGMAYSLQRYQGGNTAALGAVSDTARNVGSMFAYDEWQVSRYVALGYGANYARYDYMEGSALFSPRLSATFSPTKSWRIAPRRRAKSCAGPRKNSFLPRPRSICRRSAPSRPFQGGLLMQEQQNYRSAVERVLNGAVIGVRTFEQRIDNQPSRVLLAAAATARQRRSATTSVGRRETDGTRLG